ncbi:MAG TPA: chloride channel protein [Pirellulales bacterium]|nr:chloride channel protein [Pirellulales bacterium]
MTDANSTNDPSLGDFSSDTTQSGGRRRRPWQWVPVVWQIAHRRLVQSQVRLLGFSLVVGLVAGLAAVLFYVTTVAAERYFTGTLAGFDPKPHPGGEPAMPWLPAVAPTFHPWRLLLILPLGGLLTGWLVYTFAPEAEGHGTDAAIEAYHRRQGVIPVRVPIVKIIASAITLGVGGSGGREGPIAQIGAGFGSFFASLMRMRPADRRVLMAAGMGAGIAAIFRAPLAGSLFAAEVLYRSPEFEPEVIMPAALASVVSYSTFGVIFGWQPLFTVPKLEFSDPLELLAYLLLAVWAAFLAMLYTRSFYAITRLFRNSPIPRKLRPALGLFLSGVLALALYFIFGHNQIVLGVLGFGYGTLQWALDADGSQSILLLLAIALGKTLATGLTIGSGGSAGVFGPSMVIGGCGGGALGLFFQRYWPLPAPTPTACVLVGMAGFFAAAAKTPFSTLVMVSEITGGYPLLLPALWVCVLSFMLSDTQSIYSSQVESRSRSPAHRGRFVREVLAGVRVSQLISRDDQFPRLSAGDKLAMVIERFRDSEYPVLPVTEAGGRLLGIVNLDEIGRMAQTPEMASLLVAADLLETDVEPLMLDDELDLAMELFVENDLLALPIVDDRRDRRVIGMIRRYEIAGAYLSYLHAANPGRPAS